MSGQQRTEEQTTVGAYIRRLRNEKNISAAEVAAKMYLHLEVIEALEQDDHENLPGPLYVYGYLQHYAKILDVPADELVAMYKKDVAGPREQVRADPPQPESETKQRSIMWSSALIYLLLFILVLASFALWRSKYAQEQVENTASQDYPVTIVEDPDTPFSQGPDTESAETGQTAGPADTPEAQGPEEPREQETASAPGGAPGPVDESRATRPQFPEAPAITTGNEPETAPAYEVTTITSGAGPDTVTLVLSVDCWIEIFDAENKKVFYDLARAGQTLVLNGVAPFSVLLGNADAATVEFNNTPFDITPHVTGIGIARFVLGADQ